MDHLITINDKEKCLLFDSLSAHSTEGLMLLSTRGELLYVNPMASRCLALSDVTHFNQVLYSQTEQDHFNLNDFLGKSTELECIGKDQVMVPLAFKFFGVHFDNEDHILCLFNDLSERITLENKIKQHAFYDTLTQLPNRALLKERLTVEIARQRRSQTKTAIMYMDLDRFKLINDTLGYRFGDDLLRAVGDRLSKALRTDDFVARLGGDEYLIIAPGLHHVEMVGKVAQKLLDAVKMPFYIDETKVDITGSIGIAISPDDGLTQEELLTNADIALYRAKDMGKNTFETYTHELSTKALGLMEMERDLRHALDNQEFVVYYQPKVSTNDESIVGMEALVRWIHPKKGMIPPMQFIDLAEETGLIVPLGNWVLKTACTHNKALQDSGYDPIVVSVNLSMKQFEQYDFVPSVIKILKESQLGPEYLELEITESIAMSDIDKTRSIIRELQSFGIHFSIDDFGTGYSSLSKLGVLTVDKLKIDKSFISNMSLNTTDTVIASTILGLGKNLNMKIVAEGVETREQVQFLKDKACDEMQGYFFGKPVSIETFIHDFLRD